MKKLLFRVIGILSALLAPLLIGGVAHAASHTWTGGGTPDGSGNLLFSDSANWDVAPTTDGTAVLVFPKAQQSDKVYNDLTADTIFAGINFSVDGTAVQGTASCPTTSNYKISGNSITLAGDITGSVSPAGTTCYMNLTLNIDVTLSTAVTVTSATNAYVYIGSITAPHKTLTMGANNINFAGGYSGILASIVGSGNIVFGGGDFTLRYGDNSLYTGAITVSSGASVEAYGPLSLGSSATGTTVESGGSLGLCNLTNPSTYAEPITVGGVGKVSGGYSYGALRAATGCGSGTGGAYVPKDTMLTGAITLTANTNVRAVDNITVNGPLSGSFTITSMAESLGVLAISSSSNTSSTPNGTQAVQIITTTYSDETTDPISVGQNNIVIVTGKRGDALAVTGTLKGTGTVGNVEIYPGGVLAPGLSPGCINTGNLDLLNGTYQVELADLTVCTEYDQTRVTGTVTLGGTAVLQIVRYDNMVPRLNNSFTIISNDGTDAVSGTFAGLAQGATTVVDGITYSISYTGGDGNDVVLVVTAVDSALGAPNTGAHIIRSGILLPIFAILSAVAIIYMNFVATKKK